MMGRVVASEKAGAKIAAQWAKYSVDSAIRRLDADSLEKKYINFIGGPRDSAEIGLVANALERAGFASRMEMVPGPLMRATHGDSLGFSHMPLQPSTIYDALHECYDQAFAMANANGPDPELDLRGLCTPLWGTHSARRGADTNARTNMHVTGATPLDIDMVFGWNEHIHKQGCSSTMRAGRNEISGTKSPR